MNFKIEIEDYVTPANSALLTDYYQLTMCAAYLKNGHTGKASFELFVRSMPPNRSYMMFAGLEQVVRYLSQLHFAREKLEYLASKGIFDDDFLSYLGHFRFTGELHALEEGSIFFPGEPIMRVTAPLIEAQLVETLLLNLVNFQVLAATKASRVVHAARGKKVVDFGLRRCHGPDAGVRSARSSYLAGFAGTSNVLAGIKYGIPLYGTIAHSFIMSYESELEAFRAYANAFPSNCLLLIDTYDTLQGARNAVIVGKELEARGSSLAGVRLDSGDLLKLSKQVRAILDKGGFPNAKIFASGDLDEYKIDALLGKGAPIDSFGVGTSVGTSNDAPSLNVNYKLCEMADARGAMRPVMKFSADKRTLPGRKQVYREIDKNGFFAGDVIALDGEFATRQPLLLRWMDEGRPSKRLAHLDDIRERARQELGMLPDKYKVLLRAPAYPVKTSKGLEALIKKFGKKR
ncbi:Putative nicotinate phosphoribosyltransferase [Candidatus Burarchaeum australiense]|nr:Putative nicotinate phosphoribosyltransferase [Candidatus Burarchaeum australiense]